MALACLQVLQGMNFPVKVESVFVIVVPAEGPLGKHDRNFCNVSSQLVDSDGKILDDKPKVVFFATGRLGNLKGGLLNLKDHREILSKEQIKERAKSTVQAELEEKRSRVSITLWFLLSRSPRFLL